MNFAEKYRPKTYEQILSQGKAVEDVKTFLKEFPKRKSLILYGPAGTGKTSLVLTAAKENNMEIFELNASDLRNRTKLEQILKPATLQHSLFKKSKLILMDEVDGVTGTDIGGIPELIRLIGTSKHPIIMTCNDVWQSKFSELRSISKLVEFKAFDLGTLIAVLMNVCEKEGLKKEPSYLKQIAIKSQGDMRAALNDLESYSRGENILVDDTEKRDIEESIFNIMKRVFKERSDFLDIYDSSSLSIDEILLWLEENIPREYKNESLAKAYYELGQADVFRGRIYKNQSWRFLVYQNIFQSAGISYAKITSNPNFVKYERPKRILKIWLHNQKSAKKKTIAKKYAAFVHCSTKRAMRDFTILKPILQKPEVQNEIRLTEEEIDFLNK